MRRLCPPKAVVKKGNVEARHQRKVPQYAGTPGTLLLTHDSDGQPLVIFADKQENLTVLHAVMDERLFSDTVFRAVKIHSSRYIVQDLLWLNGGDFHSSHTYVERATRVAELLDAFHHPDLVALETVDQVPSWELVLRGHECYDDVPGSLGVFLPVKE
jgi:hypothetical protein